MVSGQSQLVAIVSGGSKGIGFSIAKQLARKSYKVAILSRNKDRAEEALTALNSVGNCDGHLRVKCDVSNPHEVTSSVALVKEKLGSVDVLVNAAGINHDCLLLRASNEAILETIRVNLMGPMYLSREVLKDMLRRRKGVILNVGSVVASVGNPGQTVYSASKSGLYGFTRSLAKEVSGRGIRVNLLEPGFVETEMTENSKVDISKHTIAMGRMAKPEEIARTALFLIGSDSSYITGQRIIADGGMMGG
eukprot:CAMPEP_0184021740 /NCGR_PEP_ID=MMETSP0954-20121128/10126_1 /TAXON_ID=627963 /ORGANISM="Aplanochytrium sp, Strain PBS07" /LENGTH=248 /DNA_ID=CAMNT_0026303853 /DNA_START=160 /DNA_END=906 /DNA_ORIENTATION=-